MKYAPTPLISYDVAYAGRRMLTKAISRSSSTLLSPFRQDLRYWRPFVGRSQWFFHRRGIVYKFYETLGRAYKNF